MKKKISPVIQKTSTAKNLEQWLNSFYNPDTQMLDLSYDNFHWCQSYYSRFGGWYTVCHEDPSYKKYLPEFMNNPNEYLNRHPEVKGLSLSQQTIWSPSENMHHLAQNKTLQYLDLSQSYLTANDIKPLAQNNTLKALSLFDNAIGDGVAYFAHNKVLESLYVSYNGITQAGAMEIKMPNLKHLSINHNPIGDQAGAAIVNQCPNLNRIFMYNTHIGLNTVNALKNNHNLTKIGVSCHETGCSNKFNLWRMTNNNKRQQKKQGILPENLSFFAKKERKHLIPISEVNAKLKMG